MKLIILDRDGVINHDSVNYIRSPAEYVFLPGSAEAIARLCAAGYHIAVATNQSGISRGYYSEAQLSAIHQKMLLHVKQVGGRIDLIVYCPHLPDMGCGCRKPEPGMLLSIAKHFNCSLEGVPFVGDRLSDVLAGKAAGASPILIQSPMTDTIDMGILTQDIPKYAALSDFVDSFLALTCVS